MCSVIVPTRAASLQLIPCPRWFLKMSPPLAPPALPHPRPYTAAPTAPGLAREWNRVQWRGQVLTAAPSTAATLRRQLHCSTAAAVAHRALRREAWARGCVDTVGLQREGIATSRSVPPLQRAQEGAGPAWVQRRATLEALPAERTAATLAAAAAAITTRGGAVRARSERITCAPAPAAAAAVPLPSPSPSPVRPPSQPRWLHRRPARHLHPLHHPPVPRQLRQSPSSSQPGPRAVRTLRKTQRCCRPPLLRPRLRMAVESSPAPEAAARRAFRHATLQLPPLTQQRRVLTPEPPPVTCRPAAAPLLLRLREYLSRSPGRRRGHLRPTVRRSSRLVHVPHLLPPPRRGLRCRRWGPLHRHAPRPPLLRLLQPRPSLLPSQLVASPPPSLGVAVQPAAAGPVWRAEPCLAWRGPPPCSACRRRRGKGRVRAMAPSRARGRVAPQPPAPPTLVPPPSCCRRRCPACTRPPLAPLQGQARAELPRAATSTTAAAVAGASLPHASGSGLRRPPLSTAQRQPPRASARARRTLPRPPHSQRTSDRCCCQHRRRCLVAQ